MDAVQEHRAPTATRGYDHLRLHHHHSIWYHRRSHVLQEEIIMMKEKLKVLNNILETVEYLTAEEFLNKYGL